MVFKDESSYPHLGHFFRYLTDVPSWPRTTAPLDPTTRNNRLELGWFTFGTFLLCNFWSSSAIGCNAGP